MDNKRLSELLARYHNNTLNDSEKQELEKWFDTWRHPHAGNAGKGPEDMRENMLREFRARAPYPEGTVIYRKTTSMRKLAVAAAVAGFLVGGAYLAMTRHTRREDDPIAITVASSTKTTSGKEKVHSANRATLILDDGSSIDLEESHNGFLAERGGVKVIKVDDSTVQYLVPDSAAQSVYHTITTPRGGQYRVSLPDGSMAWLNAAAAIRYPVAFAGTERKVQVSGEVYFEVAKDASKPFIVSIDGKEEVKVLGTHFNINAYKENGEPTVTLLEGSVKVSEEGRDVMLKPGQQSFFTRKGFHVKEANVEQVMAWKTGFLDFDELPLDAVMQEISRWYDVDVSYRSTPEHPIVFGGRISKNLPLSKVLTMLEAYGVHAQLNDAQKQVIISTP